MSECQFGNCDQMQGHPGPHGIAVAPGLILAPYGGGEGDVSPATPCPLRCDCCGSPMALRRFSKGGGKFTCSNAGCNQEHCYQADGDSFAAVIAKMFPSEMREGSSIYRDFLAHRIAETKFRAEARYLVGLIGETEKDNEISAIEKLVAEKLIELATHPHWWQFWKARK